MTDFPSVCQLDPQWVSLRHGYSTSTIGKTGCTISCIAAIAQWLGYKYTPIDIDAFLVKYNGYSAPKENPNERNLVDWTKINLFIPELKFSYRYYEYNNDIVKQQTDNGFPVLVRVYNNGYQHWVVYIGDHLLMDPIDGKIKSTAVYEPNGFTVFEYLVIKPKEASMSDNSDIYQGLNLNDKDSMRAAIDTWVAVRDGKYILKEVANQEKEEAVKLASQEGDQHVKDLENLLKEKLNLKTDDTRDAVMREIDHLLTLEDSSKENVDLKKQLEDTKIALTQCKQEKGEKVSVNWMDFLSKPFITWIFGYALVLIGVATKQVSFEQAAALATASGGIYGLGAALVKRAEAQSKTD